MGAENRRVGSENNRLRSLLILLIVSMGVQDIPDVLANSSGVQAPRDAIQVLKTYIAAEEREQYENVYNLFSQRYKEELSKEKVVEVAQSGEVKTIPVTTPALYRDLRLRGEARWSNSRIESAKVLAPNTVSAVVISTVEAEGAKERVKKGFVLVKEGKEWKIDDIRYTPRKRD